MTADYVQVVLYIRPETARRYRYAAVRRGNTGDDIKAAAKHLMAEVLNDDALSLPAPPPPADASWTQTRRHESRERNGGTSTWTQAIPIVKANP